MLNVSVEVTDTLIANGGLDCVHDNVHRVTIGQIELEADPTDVRDFLKLQFRQRQAERPVVDIERSTLDRQIPRLDDGKGLIRVDRGPARVVKVAFEIRVDPAAKLEALEEVDLRQFAEILDRKSVV